MNVRACTPLLVIGIVLLAALGLPLVLAGPMHMEVGCPFMSEQTAICARGVLAHLDHWHVAFATVLAELLIIVALALVAVHRGLFLPPDGSLARIRMRGRAPDRPTLYQELFSSGILNRKEPHDL